MLCLPNTKNLLGLHSLSALKLKAINRAERSDNIVAYSWAQFICQSLPSHEQRFQLLRTQQGLYLMNHKASLLKNNLPIKLMFKRYIALSLHNSRMHTCTLLQATACNRYCIWFYSESTCNPVHKKPGLETLSYPAQLYARPRQISLSYITSVTGILKYFSLTGFKHVSKIFNS